MTAQTRLQGGRHFSLWPLFLLSLFFQCTSATITLSESGKQYQSFPETSFGNSLSYGYEYVARLQVLPNDLYLCKNYTNKDDRSDRDEIIVPADNVPVAILARQGRCTTMEKAATASTMHISPLYNIPKETIQFLIIYDGDDDIGITDDNDDGYLLNVQADTDNMHAKGDISRLDLQSQVSLPIPIHRHRKHHYKYELFEDINVAVIYVLSPKDGIDMFKRLSKQPNHSYEEGGLRLLLDSYQGWIPGGDESFDVMTLWDVIAVTTISFFVCLCLSCLFTVNINTRAGDVVVVEPGQGRGESANRPGRYRHGLRLLNTDEVMSLPEVTFGLEQALGEIDVDPDVGMSRDVCDSYCCSDGGSDEGIGLTTMPSRSTSATSPLLSPGQADTEPPCNHQLLSHLHHFEDISCTICLEDYGEGEKLRVLPCQHAFHTDCILPWLKERSPTCPLCKAHLEVVREDDIDSDEESDGDDDDSDADFSGDNEGSGGRSVSDSMDEESTQSGAQYWPWYVALFGRGRRNSTEVIEVTEGNGTDEEVPQFENAAEDRNDSVISEENRRSTRAPTPSSSIHQMLSRMLRGGGTIANEPSLEESRSRNAVADGPATSIDALRERLLTADEGHDAEHSSGFNHNDDNI
mmetsp:Transcript_7826/g.11494  ORF Transcript_7826/g.11494 Transcript_7826/m.11494 type:complete len:635 (-) Transcript_7826:48-1952(-)|eukprot:CAMPEP_0197232896 /NCGR_PEP_ID=MMETSP1429-20130617/1097_1 /TAXON_ID=49237 /ORGANISM="Chaetoceros  sp., Strain UNC1202" /LENGTH=634 /DNA_ID=CAMNT_0042691037 /DNA_START=301 /DNA_END=2205 /DNA_ORIENTATION=-